ncbi:MAG TPA: EscU/YscU/HrcU family type III secretion system export apparatus switch protein [Steroidobacteraceae bacterium]|nr:EscU/YscU/HrcU family type III secretion system export apparatus switch protein [Steroidobacteraceae bacterium]
MAAQQGDLDRSEPATPYKLDKAHRRGSVVRSTELTFAGVMLACVACVYGLGSQVVDGIATLTLHGLSFVGRETLTAEAVLAFVGALATHAVRVVAPVAFVVWMAAFMISAMQARGVFSAQPLKPDFTRLNPAVGFKRMFSVKSLHELWRSAAKLGVITVAMALWGQHHLLDMLRLPAQPPRVMLRTGLDLLGSVLALLAGLVLVFAVLDWSINRWEFMRNMRMSKREIKDEHKEREGDPRIKSRLRELRLQWLKRARQLSKVRSADVLLTNPTHYAVALEYRHGEMPAPLITARGAGELARRMREEARRHDVPVVEHVPLARALFALDEAQVLVPEEHFTQVARILRWIYTARATKRAARSGT